MSSEAKPAGAQAAKLDAEVALIERALELFDELSELDEQKRTSCLAEIRVKQPALAATLARMFEADQNAQGVLDRGVHAIAPSLSAQLNQALQAPSSLAAGQRIGSFELVQMIGQGGMGEVWQVQRNHGEFSQSLALKVLKRGMDSAALVPRFLQERRILSQLDHPNIAGFIDGGMSDDGRLYYVMEWVKGQPIDEYVRANHCDLRAIVALMIKVCSAVAHAQSQLVVHRDLKPSNILIDAQAEPRILDFGIAKLLAAEASDAALTQTGSFAYSPAYAAPEQILGEAISTATDVYALGVILYQLWSLALPHQRSNHLPTLLKSVANESIEAPSLRALKSAQFTQMSGTDQAAPSAPSAAMRSDLDTIVLCALKREPHQRYRDATALAEDLACWLAARPIRARSDSHAYRLRLFVRRNRLAVSSALAVLFAVLLGLGASLWQANVAAQQARRAERISEFLGSLFEEQDPDNRAGAQSLSPETIVREGVLRVSAELSDDPQSQAKLLGTLGRAQMHLSDIGAAGATLERAAQIAKLSADELTIAQIDASRGELASRQANLPEAMKLLDAALARATAARGSDSVEVAQINIWRANVLMKRAQFPQALQTVESAFSVLRARLGENAPSSIRAGLTLATVQEQMRDDVRALASFLRLAKQIRTHFGARDHRLVEIYTSIGTIHGRGNGFGPARRAFAQAVEIGKIQAASRAMTLTQALLRWSTVERRDQQHEAAAKLLDQAQAALPKDHYSLQTQLHSARCALLLEQEDFGPAEHHCALAFKRLRHSNGAQSGIVWYALAERARALAGLGDFAAAHKALDRAAKKMRELLGPDAYQNALIADRQGDVLRMQNLPARAAELYRESERLAHLNYGPDHWQRYSAALSRAECLALNAQTRAQATVIVDDLWRRFASIEQVRRKPFRLASLSCSLFQQSDQENRARALVQSTLSDPMATLSDAERAQLMLCAAAGS